MSERSSIKGSSLLSRSSGYHSLDTSPDSCAGRGSGSFVLPSEHGRVAACNKPVDEQVPEGGSESDDNDASYPESYAVC